jgi:hypothetical protein
MTLFHRGICGRGLRAAMLAAGPAAFIAGEIGLIDVAAAQNNPAPVPPPRALDMPAAPAQERMQAPIGHRQPRQQDLPPDVQRQELGKPDGDRGTDKTVDRPLDICRGC